MTNLTKAHSFYLDGMTTFNEMLHSIAKPGEIVFFDVMWHPIRVSTYIGSWITPAYRVTATGSERIA